MARAVAFGNVNHAPEWRECCWPRCMALAEGGGPPLCRHHFVEVGEAYMAEHMERAKELLRATRPSAPTVDEYRTSRDAAMAAQSQVYYVRIGDHIKIGYTINMRQRLGGLRVDDDALLATEPGARELEAQRHREFAAERIGRRENFNPSRRLLAHIEAVRAEHGPPRITTYQTARVA